MLHVIELWYHSSVEAEHDMIDWSDIKSQTSGNTAGIVVNAETRAAFLSDIDARMKAQTGYTVATINLDHVVKIQNDMAFRQAYSAHSHVTADGRPIRWFSRIARHDVEMLPGSELIEPICEMARQNAVPVGLFGATDASLEAAAQALQEKFPGLEIAICLAPPMGFDPAGEAAKAAIETLKASGARLVFLALGAPKQEIFAAKAAPMMPDAGFLSIGAGLDFISGAQTRAPVWVRRIAAEWLWRLLQNPSRLAARYGACIAILPRLLRKALSDRRKLVGNERLGA